MPKQFNPHPKHPAVGFLVQLHADLGGKIEKTRQEAKRLAEDMKHVEAVIRMFAPDYDVRRIAVKRRQNLSQMVQARASNPRDCGSPQSRPGPAHGR
jgi:hypothetical protein